MGKLTVDDMLEMIRENSIEKNAFTPGPLSGSEIPAAPAMPAVPPAGGGQMPPAPGMGAAPAAPGMPPAPGAAPAAPGMGGDMPPEIMQMIDKLSQDPENAVEELIAMLVQQGMPKEQAVILIKDRILPAMKEQGLTDQANRVQSYLDQMASAEAPAPGAPAAPAAPPAEAPQDTQLMDKIESMGYEVSGMKRLMQAMSTQISGQNEALTMLTEFMQKIIGGGQEGAPGMEQEPGMEQLMPGMEQEQGGGEELPPEIVEQMLAEIAGGGGEQMSPEAQSNVITELLSDLDKSSANEQQILDYLDNVISDE